MLFASRMKKTLRVLYNKFRTNFVQSTSSLSRVFSYSKPYMYLIIIGNVALLLATFFNVLLPKYIGEVQDVMQKDQRLEELKGIVFKIAFVLFGDIILMLVKEFNFDLLAIKVITDMRKDLFKSLLSKDVEFYDLNKSGDLISRLTGDIEKVQHSSMSDIANLIRRVLEILGSLFMLLSVSPKLTIILFAFVPIKICLLALTGGATKKNTKQTRKAVAEANSSANEAFQNIRIIKAFSTEEKEFNFYCSKLSGTYKLELSCLTTNICLWMISSVLGFSALLYMIYQGGSMVANNEITSGNLTNFLISGLKASAAFNSIDKIIKRFATSLGACERIFEVLDYEPRIKTNWEEGKVKETLKGNVEVTGLSFSYPTKSEVKVLKQLDVSIKAGETIALVGASGSGKTTFTSLIQRFYDSTAGELKIDGENISNYNLKWLHQQIGYVPQEPSLFSGTIEENITYGVSEYTKSELEHAIKLANANFILDKKQFPHGLETKVGERGTKLSGGQKQRIAIARAVIKNPKILIFDEATSALDAESEHQVQQAINSLMEEKGKTLLIIAHRLSTIINCKRILVFQSGKIVEEGSHKELLQADGIYKNLVERQLAGFDM